MGITPIVIQINMKPFGIINGVINARIAGGPWAIELFVRLGTSSHRKS